MATKLEELRPLLDKCVLCGGCHPDCPTYTQSRYEHDSARGKVLLADALLKGELKPSAGLAKTFGHCLSCMACTQACPAMADPAKVIVAARGFLFENGESGFLEKFVYRKLLASRRGTGFLSAFMKLAAFLSRRLPWFSGFLRDGKTKPFPDFSLKSLKSQYQAVIPAVGAPALHVAYFVGCMADWAFQSNGKAVIGALTAAGVEVTLVEDEVCCGAPAYFGGDQIAAIEAAKKNVRAFMAGDFDHIVTSCATCGSMLKEVYPELLGGEETARFAAKIVDFQKLYADRFLENSRLFKKPGGNIKVTYHDPSHLSRGMKVTKEPRAILKSLPGVEFVEMREADACCGGAGTFNAMNYGDSLEIGARKAKNIADGGAQIVVTECPSCQMQLMDLTARHCPGVVVLHTAEFLSRFDREAR